MGISPSTRSDIERTVKEVLTTFTTEYVKWTALYMVKRAKKEAKATTWPYLLDQRPPSMRVNEIRKTGWLTKQGAIVTNWKRRWFVVKPDYSVDYFVTEQDAQQEKPKPKGTMILQGYYVYTNPNGEFLSRLKNIATKMGLNVEDLPKPKEFPPFTLEIYHWRRRCYYITCENQEEFDSWVRTFRECCWENKGLKNQDWVHVRAFTRAVRETRWRLGRWGYWGFGGSEEQILCDLVADQIEYAVMGPIWSKLTGPYFIRNQITKRIQATIDTSVMLAVKPAWTAMAKAAEQLRPVIKPQLDKVGATLGETEEKIKATIKEAVLPIVNPVMDEHVKPHVQKILDLIRVPMQEAFNGSIDIWMSMSLDYIKEVKKDKEGFMNYTYPINRPLWHTWRAKDALDQCYDPLYLLNVVFPQIWPSSVIYEGKRHIDRAIDSACYSYYNRMLALLEKDPNAVDNHNEQLRAQILEQLREDSKLWSMIWYNKALKLIIMPALDKVLTPLVDKVLSPIDEKVPEAMKKIIDIRSLFKEIVNELVDGIINPLFDFHVERIPLKRVE